MIFERTKYGEVMALARLLNVSADDLMHEAKVWQRGIESLKQINDKTYEKLLEALTLFVKLKAEGEAEVFTDIYVPEEEDEEEEEDEDGFDLERELDRCETYYEERMLRHWYNADDRYDDEIAMRIAYEDK